MKINSLHLKNFRGFADKKINNISNLQAFVGENGSGKTSVLEAINFITSPGYISKKIKPDDFHDIEKSITIMIQFDEHFIFEYIDGYWTREIPCKKVILKIKKRKQSSQNRALSDEYVVNHYVIPETYLNIENFKENLREKILSECDQIPNRLERDEEEKFGFIIERNNGKEFKVGKNSLRLTNKNDTKFFPEVFYFDKERNQESGHSFGSLLRKINRELNWRYIKNTEYEEVKEFWKGFQEEVFSKVEENGLDRLIDPVKKEMKKIFGERFENMELSLLNLQKPFDKAFFSVRKDNSAKQIKLENLGSGVEIILNFFLLKKVSELSKEEIILLIDEPELHLHPQLQKVLFDLFEHGCDYQIIYSTHSEHFIDLSKWQNINRYNSEFNYFPTEDKLNQEYFGKTIKEHLEEIKKYYRDKTIYSRGDNKLFFSRKCLLVEGVDDEYAVKKFLKLKDLDLTDLTVINCQGKTKIKDYQILCIAYNINYFTLFDEDEEGESLNDELKKLSKNSYYFCIEDSLEEHFGISSNTKHKGSKTCKKIDQIKNPEDIPTEIKESLKEIKNWLE